MIMIIISIDMSIHKCIYMYIYISIHINISSIIIISMDIHIVVFKRVVVRSTANVYTYTPIVYNTVYLYTPIGHFYKKQCTDRYIYTHRSVYLYTPIGVYLYIYTDTLFQSDAANISWWWCIDFCRSM